MMPTYLIMVLNMAGIVIRDDKILSENRKKSVRPTTMSRGGV
jgi:hypothetical protein